jgi:small-conductance mechanosensitive channel
MAQDIQSFWQTERPGLYLVLLSIVLYLIGLMLGRWLKRRVNVELGWASHLFIATAGVLVASRISEVEFPGEALIGLLMAVTAAFPINALLRRFVWPLCGYPGENARIPSFLPQVAAILVFVFAAFFGLAAFYHVTIPSLLTGSGVIAIIIGIALQDTLGNIFAGFGLQAGRAYRIGDWLIVDGKHVEVVEINWRSTRLRNNDDVSFDIPNNQLAKATIVNLYYPSRKHASRVRVSVDHRVPPNEVKDAMSKAAAATPGVLRDPAVKVFLIDFAESAVQYEIKFWLMDGRLFADIIDGVRTNVWYELNRRGIRLAFSTQQIELAGQPAAVFLTGPDSARPARTRVPTGPFRQGRKDHIPRGGGQLDVHPCDRQSRSPCRKGRAIPSGRQPVCGRLLWGNFLADWRASKRHGSGETRL